MNLTMSLVVQIPSRLMKTLHELLSPALRFQSPQVQDHLKYDDLDKK